MQMPRGSELYAAIIVVGGGIAIWGSLVVALIYAAATGF
jgi:hypothetical protein